MKTKTIWVFAVVFGLVAACAAYLMLQPKSPSQAAGPATQTNKPASEDAAKKQTNNQPVANFKDGGLANLSLSSGKRAVSVAVNEVQGVSGFITPGAYVDVVVMVPPPEGENMSAQILLQNIKVLAVGQLNATPDNNAKAAAYRTVTLEVMPNEGASLAFAGQKGAISLMLRAPGDTAAVPSAHITLEQLNKGGTPK